jgi:integrase
MAEFKAGNKAAKKRRVGPQIVKIKGRPGYYIRWYVRRDKPLLVSIECNVPHDVKLKQAKYGGLVVLEKPTVKGYELLESGDTIKRIADVACEQPEDFDRAVTAFQGKLIRCSVQRGKRGTKPQYEKAGDTRPEAKEYFKYWLQNQHRKDKGLPIKDVSFNRLCDEYLKWTNTPARSGYSDSWIRRIKQIAEMHRHRWGAYKIDQLQPRDFEEWIAERTQQGKAPSTINNELAVLRCMFKLAKEWRYIDYDPTSSIKFKRQPETAPKHLTSEEINLLLDIAKKTDKKRLEGKTISSKGGTPLYAGQQTLDQLREKYNTDGTFDTARLRFLLLTGIRKGQLINMRWEQYDKRRSVIIFEQTDYHSEKGKRVHVLPLPKAAKKLIDGQPRLTDYIWPNLEGNHDNEIANRLRRSNFKEFERETGKHIHLHMLRHTGLTELLKQTKDIKLVKEFAGHRQLKTTERYARLFVDDIKKRVINFDPTK